MRHKTLAGGGAAFIFFVLVVGCSFVFWNGTSKDIAAQESFPGPAWMHDAIPDGTWFTYDTLHEDIGYQIHVYLSPIINVQDGRIRTIVALAVSSRTSSIMEGAVVDADSGTGLLNLEVMQIAPLVSWGVVKSKEDLQLTSLNAEE